MTEQATTRRLLPGADATVVDVLLYAARAGRLIEAIHAEALRRHDLDTSQLAMLYALWTTPDREMSQGELGAILVQTQSGITRTTKRLIDRGFVSSRRDQADGRARRIRLVPAGGRALRAAFSDVVAQFAAAVENKPALIHELQQPLSELAALLDDRREGPDA